jgi:hypothetical protein
LHVKREIPTGLRAPGSPAGMLVLSDEDDSVQNILKEYQSKYEEFIPE